MSLASIRTVRTWPRRSVTLGLVAGLAAIVTGALISTISWFGALSACVALGALLLHVLSGLCARGEADRALIRKWSLWCFGAHLVIAIVIAHTSLLDYFGPDARSYQSDALQLLDSWRGDSVAPVLGAGKEGFTFLLAGLYYILGPHLEAGLAINSFFGAALLPLGFRLTTELFGRAAARPTLMLLTILPAFLVWPSQLLREALTQLLIVTAVVLSARLSKRVGLFGIAGLVLSLALLMTVRAPVGFLLAGSLLIALTASFRNLIQSISVSLATLGLAAALIVGVGLGYAGLQRALEANVGQISEYRQATSAAAGSGFVTEGGGAAEVSVAQLPLGLARVVMGPFPWETRSLAQAPGLLDAIIWLALLPVWLRGLRKGFALIGRRILILVLPAGAIAVLLALSVGNYGLLLRERAQVAILIVPLMSLGLHLRSRRAAPPIVSTLTPVNPARATDPDVSR